MLDKKTIAFIGAGSMAEAMISGIVTAKKVPANQIIVTNRRNKQRLVELQNDYGIVGVSHDDLNFDLIDIIILAMKPKDVETSLETISRILNPNQVILSVIAGVSTEFIEQALPSGQQIIRVMPNTSSKIGESATAISAGKHATNANISLAIKLLQAIGEVYVITEENMDVFTGIAGSGPAYFYYLMEQMEKEGVKAGIKIETVREIIAQTLLGAAKMVQSQSVSPKVLRENVTSPNGTTEAGINVLKEQGGGRAIAQAINQAACRSREISKELGRSLKI
ncbi:pyrroline-5-carboxylate reductase [Bacillus sp. USDA818B3_A]|uniref:pyrroline-5-carboxylate reductase n=1 Tax=Bacillus sp. USDA818B3_A TaxID=2698834 RepID=UPI00136D7791|nr:pyrroline-5-carboxylate reductase [Bacillus sp. USDA818B3_A]